MGHRRRAPDIVAGVPAARCRDCGLRSLCLAAALGGDDLAALEREVSHPRPYRRGEVLVHPGAPFTTLRLLRSGLLKTYAAERPRSARVTGFVMPGEIAGLEAVAAGEHAEGVVAVDTSSVCELPYERLLGLARRRPALQGRLFALMSGEIANARRLLALFARRTGRERVAAVLLGMARRQARRGLSASRVQLSMTGRDLASYLGLAPATLSRILHGLQDAGLITVAQGEVVLRDAQALERLAGKVPEWDGPPAPPDTAAGAHPPAARFPRPRRARPRGHW